MALTVAERVWMDYGRMMRWSMDRCAQIVDEYEGDRYSGSEERDLDEEERED